MIKRLMHTILYGLLMLVALMPFWMLYRLADLTYFLLYYVVGYRCKVVMNNLAESFPEMTDRERKAVTRKFYRNLADYFFETIKLLHVSDRQMARRMQFVNLDIIDDFVAQGRSVAVYFSHCFNWEWGTSVTRHTSAGQVNKDLIFAQVYRPLRDKWADALMLKIRSRFDSLSFAKSMVFRDILRCRRDYGVPVVVGFMSDQHPSHDDLIHVVDFMNHPTAFITGTETLARKLDMGVVYWDMEKTSRGHYRITTRMITADVTSTEPFSVTDTYADMLQQTIRRDPSLWLWTHKRWKHKVTFADNEAPKR